MQDGLSSSSSHSALSPIISTSSYCDLFDSSSDLSDPSISESLSESVELSRCKMLELGPVKVSLLWPCMSPLLGWYKVCDAKGKVAPGQTFGFWCLTYAEWDNCWPQFVAHLSLALATTCCTCNSHVTNANKLGWSLKIQLFGQLYFWGSRTICWTGRFGS